MVLTSPAFSDGQVIPEIYTCKGENINPPLVISDIPADAESLVLIFEDPDAPFQTFDHWLLWNISPQTIAIIEDAVPEETIQGTNSFGKASYGGPCPPTGSHRYIFTLFALDTTITLPPEATKKELFSVMTGHILGQTQLTGVFP